MRTLACFLAVLLTTASAHAQDEPADSAGPPREGISLGAVAIPALEGGGPWFMSAIRVSAPIGARVGVDIDAGRVFGASSKYADIRSFYAGQIRFIRTRRRPDDVARYWLTGLTYLNSTKLDGHGGAVNHKPHTALSIGHGWSYVSDNGVRAVNEIGFSGGDGFMVYASVGVQWGPPRRRGG